MDMLKTAGLWKSKPPALNRNWAFIACTGIAAVFLLVHPAVSIHDSTELPKAGIQDQDSKAVLQSSQFQMEVSRRLTEIEKRLERIEMKLDAAAGHPVWHEMSGKTNKEKKQ